MEFGPQPLDDSIGAILAHSLRGDGYAIKKGKRLTADDAETLRAAGISTVVTARLTPDDVPEDEAAWRIAAAAAGGGLTVDDAFTGRCNLRAAAPGLLRLRPEAIHEANEVDEALTIATLPDLARVSAGQMVATAKVIPYAAPSNALEYVCYVLANRPMRLFPFEPIRMALIVTWPEGQKESLHKKAALEARKRIVALGSPAPEAVVVAHETGALTEALTALPDTDAVLIFGGSATSDRRDVAPAAVVDAGGSIERFGMPVDPGNLLALGTYRGKPLVILPGCARSPALNGADWVLERLAARLPVTGEDIARMGVGGLLKEIPSRPQPRE